MKTYVSAFKAMRLPHAAPFGKTHRTRSAFLAILAIGSVCSWSSVGCSRDERGNTETSYAAVEQSSGLVISQVFAGGGDPGPCDSPLFTYDGSSLAAQPTSVHIASASNQWATTTPEESDWRLKSNALGLWSLTRQLELQSGAFE